MQSHCVDKRRPWNNGRMVLSRAGEGVCVCVCPHTEMRGQGQGQGEADVLFGTQDPQTGRSQSKMSPDKVSLCLKKKKETDSSAFWVSESWGRHRLSSQKDLHRRAEGDTDWRLSFWIWHTKRQVDLCCTVFLHPTTWFFLYPSSSRMPCSLTPGVSTVSASASVGYIKLKTLIQGYGY